MDTVESVSWEEPVLGVYGGNNEIAPRVGSEPTNSGSLGSSTATFRFPFELLAT
ncbi:hypothetical protein DPMN_089189 [Dreissena polymorpha]|uniref:Uncharacterized protein n=1 Tax=Dreissena polymorpha TaxID=45954 RepID=A0A9D4KXB7_DREPO|nr:hypothetical protein DPMN_089189 [Dreissena polymorpha]